MAAPLDPSFALQGFGRREEELRQRLARALRLQEAQGKPLSTWGGSLAQGLGNLLRQFAGQQQEADAQKGLSALRGEMEADARGLLGALPTGAAADWGALTSQDDTQSTAAATALSEAIKRQREAGLRATVGDNPLTSRLGPALLQSATSGEEMLQRALQSRKAAADRKIDDDRAERALRGTEEWREWQKTHPQAQIVVGQGGGMYAVNPRNPGAGAQPVAGPAGEPLQKDNPLSDTEAKALEAMAAERDVLRLFLRDFKPEYAGGVGSKLGTVVGQTLGGSTPKALNPDRAAFWSRFDMLRTLPVRKESFGASLSANEKASFDRANLLNPASDPKVIQQVAQELMDILDRKLSRREAKAQDEGVNPGAVRAMTGSADAPMAPAMATPERPAAAAPTVVERRKAPDGSVLVRYSDGSIRREK